MKQALPIIAVILLVLMIAVAGCVSNPTTSPQSSASATASATASGWTSINDSVIAGMIETMNETNIYSTTDVLQRIPTRLYGTAGNLQSAGFLYSKLSSIPGLKVEYEDGSYKNIIGILPGTDKSSEEIVMVGAHYDSISSDPNRAPGATDDACGVAIVLELARIMSQYQFNHTIAFALWNSEEQGTVESGGQGSNAYVESAATSSLKIPLYVNFDSSCYDPTGNFILDIMYNSQSSWAKEMMTQDNTLYSINFTLTYNVHPCGSDHKAFWSHGYPAVMTHEETHGPAHTPSDTIDKISSAYALKNGQLGMVVLAQIAGVQGFAHNT
ncbi:MAG: M28 family peptidase [Halobacteriota archaeon]